MSDSDPNSNPSEKSRRSWIKWAVIGVVAAVVVVFGGIFIYANFINDAPDKLDEDDLASAVVGTTPTTGVPTSQSGADDDQAGADDDQAGADDDQAGVDGDWAPTTASEFGYRVQEVLAGVDTTAAGRSNEITGLLTIEGTTATALDVEVQIASITSDSSQRDGQFRGRIMNADEFPTATFTLTEPIDFGSIPSGDEQIVATATGDLTLRGVTNSVTFDVTAQTTDGRIGVLGSIPVLFADYGIDNPSFGAVRTEDDGLVEFVLVFERA